MAMLFPQSPGIRATGATVRGSRAPGATIKQGCAQEPRADSSGALEQGVSRDTKHSSCGASVTPYRSFPALLGSGGFNRAIFAAAAAAAGPWLPILSASFACLELDQAAKPLLCLTDGN